MRAATRLEKDSAVGTVVLAFAGDPIVRWCWPDPHTYLTSMPRFTVAFGGEAFARNSAPETWRVRRSGCLPVRVDPARQARGYGAALMASAPAECDRAGLPAYLESTNPRNMTLYERHGFKAIGQIQVGTSPPMVPMLRPPS